MESEMIGNSAIIFGGRIGIEVYQSKIKEDNVVVAFHEFDENVPCTTIGQFLDSNTKTKDNFKTYMIFNKIESIDAVINRLTRAKEILKNQIDNSK